MQNELKIFENPEFGRIRTMEINGEPYFVGKDIALILGYAKPRNAIAAHVDEEDKKDAPIQGDLGGTQEMTVINESGLYSLILSSKLPTAKKFKMVKPEIPLALDGGMNGVRGNYYKLLEKQKSSQISITISPDFCL